MKLLVTTYILIACCMLAGWFSTTAMDFKPMFDFSLTPKQRWMKVMGVIAWPVPFVRWLAGGVTNIASDAATALRWLLGAKK